MPIYEYKCEHCGETSEDLRSMELRDGATQCATCGGDCHRVLSKFNIYAGKRQPKGDVEPEPEAVRVTSGRRGTGMRVRKGRGVVVKDSKFSGLRTGISMDKDSQVQMSNLTFNEVGTAVEVTEE